jgi:hypothetical protein
MTTSLNPNQLPNATPSFELAPMQPEDALAPDNIYTLRTRQYDTLGRLKGAHSINDSDLPSIERDFYQTGIGEMNDRYLNDVRIDPFDPRRDDYLALLNRYSIKSPDEQALMTGQVLGDTWEVNPMTDAAGNRLPSERELYTEEYNTLFNLQQERDPALEQAELKLASLREVFATQSAKRQGRFFGRGKKYEEAKTAYNEQMIKVAQFKMGDIDTTGMTDSEKNATAIALLFDEQNELRNASKEKLANTKVGKFVEWMTSGSKKARFAKGLALGVAGTVVGAGAGMLIGAAAGVGLAAAAAVTAKSVVSFGRGYAKSANKPDENGNVQGRGIQELAADTSHHVGAMNHMRREVAAGKSLTEASASYYQQRYEESELDQQDERRREGRAGLLGVAAGLVLGGLGSHIAGELIHGPNDWGKLGDWGNRSINPPAQADGPSGDMPPANDVPPAGEHGPSPNAVDNGDGPAPREAVPNVDGGDNFAPGGVDSYITGDLGTTEFTSAGLGNFHQWVDGYTVRSGDSIWSISEDYLRAQGVTNPSVYQIDAVKDTVLADFQARGIVGANGWLSAGQSLRVK